MPEFVVADVPEEVVAIWERRAHRAGLGLEEYLRSRFVDPAEAPRLDEAIDRVEAGDPSGPVGAADVVAALDEIRAERAERIERAVRKPWTSGQRAS